MRKSRPRRSLRVASAAVAAVATSLFSPPRVAAFLCGPPASATRGSRQLLHRTQQHCSSRCILRSSSSCETSLTPSANGQVSTGPCRRPPPTRANDAHNRQVVRRPRALAPLRAAVGRNQPHDGATSASGGNGLEAGSSGMGTELAAGQPREGLQQRKSGGRKPFGHITDETLDLIRASTSISEVIGQHVEMQPAGRGMVGCCPFHEDRTPSFSVDDSRGTYHCFGCGASGDVITFMMQIEGLGFREAVRNLAEEAGISLGFDNDPEGGGEEGGGGGKGWDTGDEKARREARERLSLVLQMAAQFYARCLVEMPAAGGARAHIIERGISPMTVMDFQLGYSPADLMSPLIEYLDQEGFEMGTLVDAGLLPDTSKWKYRPSSNDPRSRVDRFRGRLVVPIRDHRGLVIGFGARDLSDSQAEGSVGSGFVIPEAPPKGKASRKGNGRLAAAAAATDQAGAGGTGDSSSAASVAGAEARMASASAVGRGGGKFEKKARPPAKYLNSPETTLFKKGKNVFGLDLAKEAIRSEDAAIVVEGYFDVIKLHDAGIRCAVGVLGTAITIDQLQLCARYSKSKRVILCMDGDAAGRRAVERLCESPASSGLDSLSEAGVSVSVATIPEDSGCKDPADFLQAHGAEEFRTQVMAKAVPWSIWHGDCILEEHDFAGDANAFRRCTDRLTGFMSDLSIPTDQTFHVHRFARALAGGNEAMRHQLEFDLMNMSNEKRARKNALRRRVTGSPAAPPPPPPPTSSATDPTSTSSATPGMSTESSHPSLAPAAELRRLASGSGRSSDDWGIVVSSGRAPAAGPRSGQRQGKRPVGEVGAALTGTEGMEGVGVLRNHEWVMERVKMRKREESRSKREKYGSKGLSVWSPLMEREYGGDSGETKAAEVALRGRILDQAQRFLLALVVHDPSRRARCAEEVSRHRLSLGGERRRWLFAALTSSALSDTAAAAAAAEGKGQDAEHAFGERGGGSSPCWRGPTVEALEAGGDVLFAEVRAAAPGGYFALRGNAAGMGGVAKEGAEETLDWVFEKAEAARLAKGSNVDLVLLEVVMVMLKEQAAAKMHSLSLELADTSNAIARVMAEAASADFLALDPPHTLPELPSAATDTKNVRVGISDGDGDGEGDGDGDGSSSAMGKEKGGSAGGFPSVRRSRAEAQEEVGRLKARQQDLFERIREQREEVTELEAQRKAFTSRLPKIRAESEAMRNQEARRKHASAAEIQTRAPQSTPSPPPSSTRSLSPAEKFHNERRQQQLQELKQGGSVVGEGAGERGGELTLEDFPYRFLDEDQEPDEGINIYDVEANIAAARAARAARSARPPPPPPPPPTERIQQQPKYSSGGVAIERAAAVAEEAPRQAEARFAAAPGASASAPALGYRHHKRGGWAASARRVEAPSTPPPPPLPQQPAAGERNVQRTSAGGAAAGDRSDSSARRNRFSAAVAVAAYWNTPSSAAPPAVSVLGGGAAGGDIDTVDMERMAREAEEQMEHVSADEEFFDGSVMGW